MINQIAIAVAVIVSLGAHYYLYIWVRFKVDEGLVLNYLQQNNSGSHSTEKIVSEIALKPKRILLVCRKSKKIISCPNSEGSWLLS